jgi:hypothetical protein
MRARRRDVHIGLDGNTHHARRNRGRRRGQLLGERGGRGTSAQLLARCFSGPGARINVTHDSEPLFGFRERAEVTHVQAEALAIVFATPADEKAEALHLRRIRMRQRHRRRRGAQVDDKRTDTRGIVRDPGFRMWCVTGRHTCLWTHVRSPTP